MKDRIRQEMLKTRREMSQEEKNRKENIILDKLRTLPVSSRTTVHTYLPMEEEINIFPFIDYLLSIGARVFCPESLKGGRIRNRRLTDLVNLEDGIFGTQFPKDGEVYTGDYDLILVPGLAFDLLGNRIGYGAGYYDRFLAEHPSSQKIGLAFDFQLVNSIPSESHDIGMTTLLVGA